MALLEQMLKARGVDVKALRTNIHASAVPSEALWTPLPGPQALAYESPADELFFGGAAGGGKTDLLLGLALTKHRRSIIFRREFQQLRGAEGIIERSRRLLAKTGARFSGDSHMWRGAPGDRALEFGGVEREGDVYKYQGRPHDFIGFDEVTGFTEYQYLFLSGWLRTTIPGQRTRIVATGNPPMNVEGEWVLKRWAPWLDKQYPNPASPGELRWYARLDGVEREVSDSEPFEYKGEIIIPKSRTFIPAFLSDNPYLMNTGYQGILQRLPEPMRTLLIYGFERYERVIEDDPWQVIPTAWVLDAQERWKQLNGKDYGYPLMGVGVDIARGGSDKTVIAKRYGPVFAPLEKYPGSKTPDGTSVVRLILRAIMGADPEYINVDVIGVGASVYDLLRNEGIHATGINFAERSTARDRSGKLTFANKRAEMYWKLREALDPHGGEQIALPPDAELRSDLCAARWTPSARGILIEDKEAIRKRLNRSPDCADAIVLAFSRGRGVLIA